MAPIWPRPPPSAPAGEPPGPGHTTRPPVPTITEVVETLASLSKSDLPARIAGWLDALDEAGRWALLKLITRELRVGVSARLAKTAVAQLGGFEADEVELIWHGLEPPYEGLFAWVESPRRARNPATPRRSGRRCSPHPLEDEDFARLEAADFLAEWKWDGIRLQAVAGHIGRRAVLPRIYSRTGEDVSAPSRTSSRRSASRARSTASC